MPRYPIRGGGITNLSDLIIDADKPWLDYGITGIREVAAGMIEGDLAVRNGVHLIRLTPGVAGNVLTSGGPGHIPTYMPAGGALNRYIGVTFSHLPPAAAIVTPEQTHDEVAAPATSLLNQVTPTLTPSVGAVEAAAVFVPEQIPPDEIAAPDTAYDLEITDNVAGAVADDGGVQTDETVAATNDALNDMTLLPAAPALDDAYYFGHAATFPKLRLKIDTRGQGVWTITWEYSQGGGVWAALAGVVDETISFKPAASGTYIVSFTVPGAWATDTIAGLGPMYWIRAKVTAYVSIIAHPHGSRAWVQNPV